MDGFVLIQRGELSGRAVYAVTRTELLESYGIILILRGMKKLPALGRGHVPLRLWGTNGAARRVIQGTQSRNSAARAARLPKVNASTVFSLWCMLKNRM